MLRLRAKKLPLTVQGSYTSKNVERIQNCGTEDSIIELLLGGYAFCHSIVCNIWRRTNGCIYANVPVENITAPQRPNEQTTTDVNDDQDDF
jgi:hypothetical protein